MLHMVFGAMALKTSAFKVTTYSTRLGVLHKLSVDVFPANLLFMFVMRFKPGVVSVIIVLTFVSDFFGYMHAY